MRFNQLPEGEILGFLHKVTSNEKLDVSKDIIKSIQNVYQSDIRSMINYIQSNQNVLSDYKIINYDTWSSLTNSLKQNSFDENIIFINNLSLDYGIEKKNLLKDYLNYLIKNNTNIITPDFLNFVENLLHNTDLGTDYFVKYAILRLSSLL